MRTQDNKNNQSINVKLIPPISGTGTEAKEGGLPVTKLPST